MHILVHGNKLHAGSHDISVCIATACTVCGYVYTVIVTLHNKIYCAQVYMYSCYNSDNVDNAIAMYRSQRYHYFYHMNIA